MRRRLLAVAAGALVVAGCGSSSEPESSGSTSSKPAPAKTEAPKASSGGAAAETAKATIKDFTFGPETVTVKAGGSVTWTNKDSANHNVAFDDKSVKGIGNLREGQNGKVSFAKAGTYAYVCTYHPGMEGKVIVK